MTQEFWVKEAKKEKEIHAKKKKAQLRVGTVDHQFAIV